MPPALAAALDKARGEQVDALAPTNFAAAVQAQRSSGQRCRSRPQCRTRCARECRKAKRHCAARRLPPRLRGNCSARVIKAREDALTAEAPKFAPEAWHEGRRALPRGDGGEREERHQECAATRGRSRSPAARSRADRDQGRHPQRSARADRAGRRSQGRQARAAQPAGGEALPRRSGTGNPAQSLRRERAAQARRAGSLRSAARDLSRAADRARVAGRGRRPGGHRSADPVVGRAAEADRRRRWSCRRSSTRACRRRCRRSASTRSSRRRKCAASSRSWPIATSRSRR